MSHFTASFRVCKRWKRLVKDQRLWRLVDLTAWKGVRVLTMLFTLFDLLYIFINCSVFFLLGNNVTIYVHHIDSILEEIRTYNEYMKSYGPEALIPIEITLPIHLVLNKNKRLKSI